MIVFSSITTRLDYCYHRQLNTKPSYFYHLAALSYYWSWPIFYWWDTNINKRGYSYGFAEISVPNDGVVATAKNESPRSGDTAPPRRWQDPPAFHWQVQWLWIPCWFLYFEVYLSFLLTDECNCSLRSLLSFWTTWPRDHIITIHHRFIYPSKMAYFCRNLCWLLCYEFFLLFLVMYDCNH